MIGNDQDACLTGLTNRYTCYEDPGRVNPDRRKAKAGFQVPYTTFNVGIIYAKAGYMDLSLSIEGYRNQCYGAAIGGHINMFKRFYAMKSRLQNGAGRLLINCIDYAISEYVSVRVLKRLIDMEPRTNIAEYIFSAAKAGNHATLKYFCTTDIHVIGYKYSTVQKINLALKYASDRKTVEFLEGLMG
jgi:hypothetical protein